MTTINTWSEHKLCKRAHAVHAYSITVFKYILGEKKVWQHSSHDNAQLQK
jgi:hypothetical protein